MIDIIFEGYSATCCFISKTKRAVFVISYHPKFHNYTFIKKFDNMDCKSFNRFLSRCMDCVKAYYE